VTRAIGALRDLRPGSIGERLPGRKPKKDAQLEPLPERRDRPAGASV